MPYAARVADVLQKNFDVNPEFVKGDGGILEIRSGTDIVWTNRDQRGTKPSDSEVLSAYRKFISR